MMTLIVRLGKELTATTRDILVVGMLGYRIRSIRNGELFMSMQPTAVMLPALGRAEIHIKPLQKH
ncbi:MAG: hypothetical protein QME64_07410 [bacterium]|nr:hypothetical protein [bacterium]